MEDTNAGRTTDAASHLRVGGLPVGDRISLDSIYQVFSLSYIPNFLPKKSYFYLDCIKWLSYSKRISRVARGLESMLLSTM